MVFRGRQGSGAQLTRPFSPRRVRGSVVGGWISFAAALLEAVAIAVHLQDVNVVSQAVE
jgi:hypothetical protein